VRGAGFFSTPTPRRLPRTKYGINSKDGKHYPNVLESSLGSNSIATTKSDMTNLVDVAMVRVVLGLCERDSERAEMIA
jgi:hypothetical protein